jgi:two-component system CheB/CheR fusion protein
MAKQRTTRPGKHRPPRRAKAEPAPAVVKSPEQEDDVENVSDVSGDAAARRSDVTVVGVGASAGGLEAFSQLLQGMPENPGLAMVLVQHLAPQHESALPVLLSARTPLKVVQATEGATVKPNHVYVIPPNVQMGVRDGQLHLIPRPTDRSQYTPIDYFLRSLADTLQDRAIAVILSGTASDGTLGVREVKAVGGITIAQRPETAKYDGMPRAAIATGLIDLVLSPGEIGPELVRISRHPLRRARAAILPPFADDVPAPLEEQMEQIFALLRAATGVDFRRYKRPTIQRRLHRRMVLHKLSGADAYVKFLRENPAEVQALYRDVLIHVTRFFREPDSFAAITAHVLPAAIESQRDDQPIRIWVPGCSTGEEAYSIAIVVLEFLAERGLAVPVQVFATDVSEPAIEHARTGLYPEGIAADVSIERLRRFFSRVDGGYRVNKAVRDLCIFARQDLTRDPPFSKLDLILCRNVLIYMGAEIQKKLMSMFHYALKSSGFLILGAAETIGLHSDLFSIADKKSRIYQKRLVASREARIAFDYTGRDAPVRRESPPLHDEGKSVQTEANRLIQDRYAPPGAIVDPNLNVVQFRGQTGVFLTPAPGDASHSILKMAREGLLHGLRSAFQEARRTRARVRRTGIRVRANGGWHECAVEVFPLASADRPHFLVLFEETSARHVGRGRRRSSQTSRAPTPGDPSVARLEEELASSREYLQSIIQELEAANEELQSANEEVLSANEELQSTNEELDTAKEELQSTNEQLNTVNEELHGRNEELARLNSDLMNLLGSVQIAIVIVSADLRIRRFTPMAERVLNLLPGDIGRPIGHIKPNIDCPDLEEMIARVVDTVEPVERHVRDRQGTSYALRVRPYKSVENRIDGAVLALFDIQEARDQEDAVRRARAYADGIVKAVPQPLVVIDRTLAVQSANDAFLTTFGLDGRDVEGRPLHALPDGARGLAAIRGPLEQFVAGGDRSKELQLDGGGRPLRLSVRRVDAGPDRDGLLVVAIEQTPGRGTPEKRAR